MARIPQPEPLFAEPDHAPELEAQDAYEELRTNPWLGTDDEPPTVARVVKRVTTTEVTTQARYCTFCANGFHSRCTGSGGATVPPKPYDGPRTCECGDAGHEPEERVLEAMRLYRGY